MSWRVLGSSAQPTASKVALVRLLRPLVSAAPVPALRQLASVTDAAKSSSSSSSSDAPQSPRQQGSTSSHAKKGAKGPATTASDLLNIVSGTGNGAGTNRAGRGGARTARAAGKGAPATRKADVTTLLASADPALHTLDDVNKHFVIGSAFEQGAHKHFLSRARQAQVDSTGFNSFLLRESTLMAGAIIDKFEGGSTVPHVFFTGNDNNGKSMNLAYLLQKYLQKGWIVIPVLNGADLVLDPAYIDRSSHKEGRWDSTLHARQLLDTLFEINGDKLDTIATTRQYSFFNGSATVPISTPLQDLLTLIKEDDRSAADVACIVLKEIFSAKRRPNVLLCVDGVNGLFEGETPMKDMDEKPLDPENLTLVRHLRKYIRSPHAFNRGAVAAATSMHHGVLQELNEESRGLIISEAPYLSSVGHMAKCEFPSLDTPPSTKDTSRAAYRIQTKPLSQQEVASVIGYHNAIGWSNQPASASFAETLRLSTAGEFAHLTRTLNSV